MLLTSSWNSFVQLLGVLVIFALVLVITYFVTRWIGGFQKMQMMGRSVQIIDTVRIAGNKYIQILKLGDVYLVIAVGKDEVTMLAKLTAEELGMTGEQSEGEVPPSMFMTGAQESFQETLDKIRQRFSRKQD